MHMQLLPAPSPRTRRPGNEASAGVIPDEATLNCALCYVEDAMHIEGTKNIISVS